VKGCWLGLSPSGGDSHANLAGLLLDGGANNNSIGSTTPGERNVISGNTYEGATVSDSGTDNNSFIGNIIGAAAIATTSAGRAALRGDDDLLISNRLDVANGSAGVFLSKGTKGTRVGGTASGTGNLIAHNGGTGLQCTHRMPYTIRPRAT